MKKYLKFLRYEFDPAFAERAKLIFNEADKRKPKKILDAGCGRGFYLKVLSSFSFIKEIHGVDINDNYLKIAKKININKRVKIKNASLYNLPYQDKYFDLIICSEVLEHLEDDIKAILELKRVLKPEGAIIITVPHKNFPFLWDPFNWLLMKFFHTHINKNIWWLAGIWADHLRLYEEKDIKNKLKKSGLKIVKFKKIVHWCWPFSHFLLYGIGKNLVEKMNLKSFDRFNFETKNKSLKLFANLFSFPSRFLDKKFPKKSAVNLFLVLTSN